MKLDERLVQAARELAIARYGHDGDWAGAAAMYTDSGALLTSVYIEAPNPGAMLCCETGAICEAHKRNERIVATVCVGRDGAGQPFEILAPCGLCMERLAWFGPDVECAVPDGGSGWKMMRLRELQPHRWDRWQPVTKS
jgi:cytidine deaminase